jgi:hypothetical protein
VRRKAVPAGDVSRLAGQCRIVAQAGRIAAWVGDGRAVSAKGVPRRSDLSAVASALDVEIPGHVVSAADVKAVRRPWIVAEAAGMITIGAGRAVAAYGVRRDPLEVWLRGLEAVLRAESTDSRRRGAAVVCPGLLAVLADGRSRDRRELEDAVFELLESSSPENLGGDRALVVRRGSGGHRTPCAQRVRRGRRRAAPDPAGPLGSGPDAGAPGRADQRRAGRGRSAQAPGRLSRRGSLGAGAAVAGQALTCRCCRAAPPRGARGLRERTNGGRGHREWPRR